MLGVMHHQKILVFKVGVVACCAPVRDVESILTPTKLAIFPGQAYSIAGVFQHRGKTVSVVDLRVKFGLQNFEQHKGRFVIAKIKKGLTGFWVDEILEITEAQEHHWQRPPGFVAGEMFGKTLLLDGKLVLSTDFQRLYEMENAGPLSSFSHNHSNVSDPSSSKQESSSSSFTHVNSVNKVQKKPSILTGDKFVKTVTQQFSRTSKLDKGNSVFANSTVVTVSANNDDVKTASVKSLHNRQQKNTSRVVGADVIEKTPSLERLSSAKKPISKTDSSKINATKKPSIKKISSIRQGIIVPVKNRDRKIPLNAQENIDVVCVPTEREDPSLMGVIPGATTNRAAAYARGFPVTHEIEAKSQSFISSRFQASAKGGLLVVLTMLFVSSVFWVYNWSHLGVLLLEDLVQSDAIVRIGDKSSKTVLNTNVDVDTATNEMNPKLFEDFQKEQRVYEERDANTMTPMGDSMAVPRPKIAGFSNLPEANSQKRASLGARTEERSIELEEKLIVDKNVLVLPVIPEWGMYSVVQGDTLWAISILFYRTPFRYPDLARWSMIENPDLIFPDEIVIYQKARR